MTWKLLVSRVLVPPHCAPGALDCHFRLGCSHSHFIFSESNSSGGHGGAEGENGSETAAWPAASRRVHRILRPLCSPLGTGLCLAQVCLSWPFPTLHTASGEP